MKKNQLLKDTREDKLRLKHEVECSKQVEIMQNQYITAKEKDIDRLMKEVKAEKDNSVSIIAESKNKKKEINQLKQVVEARHKEISDLQEKLKSDEVVVVELPDERQRVLMNKTNSGPKCLPCERRFVTERDLENHINAKHQQKKCPLCDENFKAS